MWGNIIAAAAPALIGAFGARKGSKQAAAPAAAAQEYIQRNPAIGHQYYDPFIQQGQRAEQGLYPEYEKMGFNTPEFYNAFTSGYSQSPAYKYMHDQLMKNAQNTAAAGGFLGTDYDVQNRSELLHQLLGTDFQNYFNNLMATQGRGLEGLEQRAGRGFQASGNLADYLGNTNIMGGQAAGIGAEAKNKARSSVYGELANLVGTGVNAYNQYNSNPSSMASNLPSQKGYGGPASFKPLNSIVRRYDFDKPWYIGK